MNREDRFQLDELIDEIVDDMDPLRLLRVADTFSITLESLMAQVSDEVQTRLQGL